MEALRTQRNERLLLQPAGEFLPSVLFIKLPSIEVSNWPVQKEIGMKRTCRHQTRRGEVLDS